MISHATPEDVPDLAHMLHALQALHAAQVPGQFHSDADPSALADWFRAQFDAGSTALVYKAGGATRGYLLWHPQERPKTLFHHPRRLAELEHIYVEPIWRRRGVASRLIARFEAELAGYDGWTTTVHAFNSASEALMRRHRARCAVLRLIRDA